MTFFQVNDKEAQLASTSIPEGYEARQLAASLLQAWESATTDADRAIVRETLCHIIASANSFGVIPDAPASCGDPDFCGPAPPSRPADGGDGINIGQPTSISITEPGLVMGLSSFSSVSRSVMYTNGQGMDGKFDLAWNTSGQLATASISNTGDGGTLYEVGDVIVPQCWFPGTNDVTDIITYPRLTVTSIFPDIVPPLTRMYEPTNVPRVCGEVSGVANGSYDVPLEAKEGQNGTGKYVILTVIDGIITTSISSYLTSYGGAAYNAGYLTGEQYFADCSSMPGFTGYVEQPVIQIVGMSIVEEDPE